MVGASRAMRSPNHVAPTAVATSGSASRTIVTTGPARRARASARWLATNDAGPTHSSSTAARACCGSVSTAAGSRATTASRDAASP
ncbi:hypothetical protein PHK61_24150 [Actinomycetospora lutea]|uniref:hypothetical protein n=1 Tax=Actinomycetospora lutea TaxID=663604 RepID=UPI002365FE7F|nr:hypothetical protein [Actinomycetospora lutea]MDD7941517.1 hypothetical protein [Actinomycetospora lutea]